MKTYSEKLTDTFKVTGTAYIIGNSISLDKLIELGIEAEGKYSLSPIDDINFVKGVCDTKDENKIKILFTYTASIPSEFIEENGLLSNEYLPYVLGNRRISSWALNHEELKNKIIEELQKTQDNFPKKDFTPIIKNLIQNPMFDRALVGEIISGENQFDRVPLYQRFQIGSESSKVNYIDDSFSGQDSPTSNELYFNKPNEALLHLIIQNIENENSKELESIFENINYTLLELYGTKCFNPDKYVNNEKTEFGTNKIILKIIEKIKKYNDFENLNEKEFKKGISYLIIITLIIDSLYGETKNILDILEKQNNWICQGAIAFHKKIKWYEELTGYDEMIERFQSNQGIDKKYIKRFYDKLKESMPKINNTGGKIGNFISWIHLDLKTDKAQELLNSFQLEDNYSMSNIKLDEAKIKLIDYLRLNKNYQKKWRYNSEFFKKYEEDVKINDLYNLTQQSFQVINKNLEYLLIIIVLTFCVLLFFKN